MKPTPAVYLVCLFLTGCSLFLPKETLYLRSAQDRDTQADVEKNLGHPRAVVSQPSGESLLIYEVRHEQTGSRWTGVGTWCDQYVLTFDQQDVLRHWTHQSYFHNGELMPTYCVPAGYPTS